jgi:hypothetical protein
VRVAAARPDLCHFDLDATANPLWNIEAIEAFKEAVAGQGRPSGVKWADALSTSVRPVITYLFMALYCTAKGTAFFAALNAGAGWVEAVQVAWTGADQALWAGVLNFWYVGRVWERRDARS